MEMSEQIASIKDVIGKPTYEGEGYMIYLGDCLESLRRLPDNQLALTVTSPPYNIGKEYEHNFPLPDYLDWCSSWMTEIHRLTAVDGAFWLNLGYLEVEGKGRAVPLPYLLWDKSPFYLLQEVIWHYGAGVASKKTLSPRNEKFLWYVRDANEYLFNLDAIRDPNVKYPNQKKNGKLKCNPLGKNPSDVWQFPKVTSGRNRSSKERMPHPAQFPLAVIDRIIKACSSEGDLVLDPFLGSGTTIEAALRNNRQAIGFELREDYASLAAERIENYLAKRAEHAEQQELFGTA